MQSRFRRLRNASVWADNRGQDLVEYALVAGVLALTAVAVMPSFLNTLSALYSKVASTVVEAMPSF